MADFTTPDDDPDSAAMAEAMGFTGFGMQRGATRKRKLTPPSHTGANSAPLGKRRPMNLPQPVASGGGGGGASNAEEINLDDDDEEEDVAGPKGDGGDVEDDEEAIRSQQAGLDALGLNDAHSAAGQPPQLHQLPPKPPQQQQSHHHAGKAARHPGGRAGGGPGQVPWWEREWDQRLVDRMVENPWDRLERQRGLEARGTWPASRGTRAGGGGGRDGGAAGPAGAGGGGAMGSLGGGGQAVQATAS